MPVISFANAKGGAGKTTAALLLACELARKGHRVTLIDADPQHWTTQWYQASGGVQGLQVISEVTVAALHCHLREAGDRTDYFIIDLPGTRDALTTAAISLSDHVCIPIQGSAMDARGGAQILDLIAFLKEKTGLEVAHSVVLTRVTQTMSARALLMIKGMLAARGVHVLNTAIAERVAFKELFDAGATLYTLDPHKVSGLDKARDNAAAFAEEAERMMPARVVSSPRRKNVFRFVWAA